MKKAIIALVFLLTGSIFAKAQENRTISLNEAIDLALDNNYELAVAKNNLELAGDKITGAKADFFPSLSANFSARENIGRQFVPGTSDFVDQPVKFFNGSLNTSVVLFSGFANIYDLRNAQFGKKSQKETVQWTRESIIFNTASAYLQVLLNKELLEIAKENLEASKKTLNQVENQTEVGSKPIADLYNQQATVANNQLQVTNRKNDLKISRVKLVRILQIDPLKEYRFVIPEVDIDKISKKAYNLPQLIAAALENRSDLQGAKYDIEAIKYQLKLTKSNYWPTLSFGASLSSGYSDQFFSPTGEP